MMKKSLANTFSALVLLAPTACGVEGFFSEGFDDSHPVPAVGLTGSSSLMNPTVEVLLQDDSVVEAMATNVDGQSFDVTLPLACYQLSRVIATSGQRQYKLLIPQLSAPPPPSFACGSASGVLEGVQLDAVSTAALLVIEARMSVEGRNLSSYDPGIVQGVLDVFYADAQGASADVQQFVGWVENVVQAGAEVSEDPEEELDAILPFQTPGLTPTFGTATSALALDYIRKLRVDFDGDGMPDTTTTAIARFDEALAALALEYNPDGCLDPDVVRVVFEVDFNAGLKDGNCSEINRFKWVTDEPGKQMFFVGGIHMDSPTQDAELDRSLGNPGSWQPNTIAMSDDGTNGDAVAGDNIWTVFFDMPRGTRVGYKYTWGKRRDLWTGTEEWPGNQRILEAIDVNEDGYVYRRDNFQDEATNKDKSNLYRQGMGIVEWDTDADGDGIPDARERPIDLDNDCSLDKWLTPAGVGPATVDCKDVQGQ